MLHFWTIVFVVNLHTKFEVCSFSRSRDVERDLHVSHIPLSFILAFFESSLVVNLQTKLVIKICSFICSRDIEGVPQFKSRLRPFCLLILHFQHYHFHTPNRKFVASAVAEIWSGPMIFPTETLWMGRGWQSVFHSWGPNYTKFWEEIHFSPMLPEFVLGIRYTVPRFKTGVRQIPKLGQISTYLTPCRN